LEGEKTIESRFTVNRHVPFEQAKQGDLIVLKRSSGPIVGICKVTDAWFYRLAPETWPEIERYAGRHLYISAENKRFLKFLDDFRAELTVPSRDTTV
jgi:hypothetical protein